MGKEATGKAQISDQQHHQHFYFSFFVLI